MVGPKWMVMLYIGKSQYIYIHVYYVIISKYDYVCMDIHVHNPTRWGTNLLIRRLLVLPYICMKNIEDIG